MVAMPVRQRPRCPICSAPVTISPEGGSFPFCSPRCKLIDLGNWLDGRYAVPDEHGGARAEEWDEGGT